MVAVAQAVKTLYVSSTPSAFGTCTVMATEAGVCWAGTPGAPEDEGMAWILRRMHFSHVVKAEEVAPLQEAMEQLRRYLAGERVQFSCALDLYGTSFQLAVWQELYRIPYGEIRTYAEIANVIGRPRAVGAANGSNPVAIIVPCHRVIGSNGTLTGYGGGLPIKRWLLTLEGNTQFQ